MPQQYNRRPEIRFDMAQFAQLKAVIEHTLGTRAYHRIKDAGPLQEWKKQLTRLLLAMQLSVEDTIQVVDDDWREEIKAVFEDGQQLLKESENISELFSRCSATLSKLVFLQIGFIPYRTTTVELRKGKWNLAHHRSVLYVQTGGQRNRYQEFRAKMEKAKENADSDP